MSATRKKYRDYEEPERATSIFEAEDALPKTDRDPAIITMLLTKSFRARCPEDGDMQCEGRSPRR